MPDRLAKCGRRLQQWRNVAKQNARLGKIGNIADKVGQRHGEGSGQWLVISDQWLKIKDYRLKRATQVPPLVPTPALAPSPGPSPGPSLASPKAI